MYVACMWRVSSILLLYILDHMSVIIEVSILVIYNQNYNEMSSFILYIIVTHL